MKIRHALTILLAAALGVASVGCAGVSIPDEVRNLAVTTGTVLQSTRVAYEQSCATPPTPAAKQACEVAYIALDRAIAGYTTVNEKLKAAK